MNSAITTTTIVLIAGILGLGLSTPNLAFAGHPDSSGSCAFDSLSKGKVRISVHHIVADDPPEINKDKNDNGFVCEITLIGKNSTRTMIIDDVL